jgi:hypothetical protein
MENNIDYDKLSQLYTDKLNSFSKEDLLKYIEIDNLTKNNNMKSFTIENRNQLLGKVVKLKDNSSYGIITSVYDKKVNVFGMSHTYDALLDCFLFEDGSACGIEDKFPLTFNDICQDLNSSYYSEYLGCIVHWEDKSILIDEELNRIKIFIDVINSKFKKV